MKYLSRRGDMDEIAQIPSICIFDNLATGGPRFGFVVPTYRRADLLQYALNSILQQDTAVTFEILVVDDNPVRNDETEQLMTSLYNRPGIAYYKNSQNLRQEGNWNKLFELVRTEWVIMLHDDDMLYPDYMTYLQHCMESFPSSIGGFFPCFIGQTFEDDTLPPRSSSVLNARVIKEVDFLQGCILGAPLGMCVKRTLIHQIGGVNKSSSVAVDYDFFNRLVKAADVVKMYDYPLGVWRIMDNVSQKVETPLFCVHWGDTLKMETLEDCGLRWLAPLFRCYVRGFDRQHICSWYKEMEKGDPDPAVLPKASRWDMVVYKVFRWAFAVNRRIGRKSCQIAIEK